MTTWSLPQRINSLFFGRGQRGSGHIEALDGVRGLAILFVLCSHLSNAGLHLVPGIDLSGIGYYGVYLFFVLSAFLLTYPFTGMDASTHTQPTVWIGYVARRLLRILPPYLVVLVVSLLTTAVLGRYTGGKGLPFTMTAGEFARHAALLEGKSVLWCIPVLVKSYALLPAILVLFCVVLKQRVGPCLVAAAGLVLGFSSWAGPPAPRDVSLRVYVPAFVLGSLAAVLHRRMSALTAGAGASVQRKVMETAGVVALFAVLASTPSFAAWLTGRAIPPSHFHGHVVAYGLLWSLFILGAINGHGALEALLSCRFLRFMGTISFSLYLWHMAVVIVVLKTVRAAPPVMAVLVLILAVGVSTACYLLFERPVARLRLRVGRKATRT